MSLATSAFWALLISALVSAIAFVSMDGAKRTRKSALAAARIGLSIFFVFLPVLFLFSSAEAWLDNALRGAGLYYGWGVLAYGVMLAIVLYQLRKHNLHFYALLECAAGVLALLVFAQTHPGLDLNAPQTFATSDLTGWIAGFAAPVYILVRGLTNRKKARDKQRAASQGTEQALPAR